MREALMKISYKISLLLLALAANSIQAQTITQLCNQYGAGPGSIDAVTFNHSGVDRYYCVYKPSSYPLTPPQRHRVVFAFHGGSGDARVLLNPAKGFLQQAEADSYVAVFAQGSSRSNCGRDFSNNNNWSDQDCNASKNIGYTREMIRRVMQDYQVQRKHIQLAGFSGGAKHIYRMIGQWQPYDPVIRAVATMAGSLHKTTFKTLPLEYESINILSGVPTNTLLFQGGNDDRMPTAGGLSARKQEILASFQYKVDNFVALNSTRSGAGEFRLNVDQALIVNTTPVPYPLGSPALAAVVATRYAAGATPLGDAETVAVLAPNAPHQWLPWMSPETFRFFRRF